MLPKSGNMKMDFAWFKRIKKMKLGGMDNILITWKGAKKRFFHNTRSD